MPGKGNLTRKTHPSSTVRTQLVPVFPTLQLCSPTRITPWFWSLYRRFTIITGLPHLKPAYGLCGGCLSNKVKERSVCPKSGSGAEPRLSPPQSGFKECFLKRTVTVLIRRVWLQPILGDRVQMHKTPQCPPRQEKGGGWAQRKAAPPNGNDKSCASFLSDFESSEGYSRLPDTTIPTSEVLICGWLSLQKKGFTGWPHSMGQGVVGRGRLSIFHQLDLLKTGGIWKGPRIPPPKWKTSKRYCCTGSQRLRLFSPENGSHAEAQACFRHTQHRSSCRAQGGAGNENAVRDRKPSVALRKQLALAVPPSLNGGNS